MKILSVLITLIVSGLFLAWCGVYFAVIPIIDYGWVDPVSHILFLGIGLVGVLVAFVCSHFIYFVSTSSSSS